MRRKRLEASSLVSIDIDEVDHKQKKSVTFKPHQQDQDETDETGKIRKWYLIDQDETSLMKLKKSELAEMSTERGLVSTLQHENFEIFFKSTTKLEITQNLLHWKKYALPPFLSLSNSVPDLSQLSLISLDNPDEEQVENENEIGNHVKTDSAYSSAEIANDLLPIEMVEIGEKIGSGAFKTVFKAQYNNSTLALSIIQTDKLHSDEINDITNEIGVLRTVLHENVLRFIGYAYNQDDLSYWILTEYCPHGDLSMYMQSAKCSWRKQLSIMLDLSLGLVYLHTRRPSIIHRDLKSLNILIDGKERAKIGDFGLSKTRSRLRAKMRTVVGTINWQAPEMWEDEPKYTEKVDVYSCALIFWEVFNWSSEYPFSNLTDKQIYEKVGKSNLRPSIDHFDKKYPSILIELMERMWDPDANVRPSMLEVVEVISQIK